MQIYPSVWERYTHLFIVHSPITDLIRYHWTKFLPRTLTLASRGYKTENTAAEIDESIESCLDIIFDLSRNRQKGPFNLCLPHSGLHGWRFLTEHPIISSYIYVEEGTHSSLKRPEEDCLPPLGGLISKYLKLLDVLGYEDAAKDALSTQSSKFFELKNRKYLGCVALSPSAFQGFPNRFQLPTPDVYSKHPHSTLIALPYIHLFKSAESLKSWISQCFFNCNDPKVKEFIISPHPSNNSFTAQILSIARSAIEGFHCELISSFRERESIPVHIETGLIEFSHIITSSTNSTVFYSQLANSTSRCVIVPLT
jgi:hypothetical protein